MPIFPEKGKMPNPVIPDKEAMKTELGPLRFHYHKNFTPIVNWADKYLGWIATNEVYKERDKPEGERPATPPPAPGYSRGARILNFARRYADADRDKLEMSMIRDAEENGIELNMRPRYMMKDDPDGYYRGGRAWVNRDLKYDMDPLELGRVGSHEIFEAMLSRDIDIDTGTAHNLARSNEMHMAIEYALGRKDVVRRYVERAKKEHLGKAA